jgi:diguanylate cyclase (GGDEF)-like protein/PAS domain S-box-containing protein
LGIKDFLHFRSPVWLALSGTGFALLAAGFHIYSPRLFALSSVMLLGAGAGYFVRGRHGSAAQASAGRLKRARAALNASLKAIVRAREELTLLQGIADLIVSVAPYKLAFVSYIDDTATKTFKVVSFSGVAGNESQQISKSWDATGPGGQASCATALRTGEACVIADIQRDDRIKHWREPAQRYGLKTIISVPIKDSDTSIGAVSIVSDDPDAFDPDEVGVLSELVDNLSYGITSLRLRREQLRVQGTLRETEARYRATFNQAAVGIAHTSIDGKFLDVNHRLCAILGFEEFELLAKSFDGLVAPGHSVNLRELKLHERDHAKSDVQFTRRDGLLQWCRITFSLAETGRGSDRYVIAVIEDIAEQKDALERIEFLSNHDALTRLPNRALLEDRLGRSIARARRDDRMCALLSIDVDRFRTINESMGSGVADALLKRVADRISSTLRETDTVARQGADEFMVVLKDIKDHEQVSTLCDKILKQIARPYFIDGHHMHVTASIGASLFPSDAEEQSVLLRNADEAMYAAKSAGRNAYRLFSREIGADYAERVQIEAGLNLAVSEAQFDVYYQPQVQVSSGRVLSVEALIRWRHPLLGAVSPSKFIPSAEESGLIVPITESVLFQASSQSSAWRANLGLSIAVAVNASAVLFFRKNFPEMIRSVLEEAKLAPEQLEIEVTESTLMLNTEATVRAINDIRAMGVQIAIDDFGTGYSSLAYLRHFPVNKIKIDQSFVRDLNHSPASIAIVRSMISLGHDLGLSVVAEGVETLEELEVLTREGCDCVQGFYYSQPLPALQLQAWLKHHRHSDGVAA